MENRIRELVQAAYWQKDLNCARTTLLALGDLNQFSLHSQLMDAAIGMHGAGRFRAQCGLVEGMLLFLGAWLREQDWEEKAIVEACHNFAAGFTTTFGSLVCRDLRPGGFQPTDPPHLCEELTIKAIAYHQNFIQQLDSAARLTNNP